MDTVTSKQEKTLEDFFSCRACTPQENPFLFPVYEVQHKDLKIISHVIKPNQDFPWLCCECLSQGVFMNCIHTERVQAEFTFILNPKMWPTDPEEWRKVMDCVAEVLLTNANKNMTLLYKVQQFLHERGKAYKPTFVCEISEEESEWLTLHLHSLPQIEAALMNMLIFRSTNVLMRKHKSTDERNMKLVSEAMKKRNEEEEALLEKVKEDIKTLNLEAGMQAEESSEVEEDKPASEVLDDFVPPYTPACSF